MKQRHPRRDRRSAPGQELPLDHDPGYTGSPVEQPPVQPDHRLGGSGSELPQEQP